MSVRDPSATGSRRDIALKDPSSRAHATFLSRWRRISGPDRALLCEAMALLAFARVAIALLPFETVGRIAAPALGAALPAHEERIRIRSRVQWAVRACARRAPFKAVCFQQGLAAQLTLAQRHILAPSISWDERVGTAVDFRGAPAKQALGGEIPDRHAPVLIERNEADRRMPQGLGRHWQINDGTRLTGLILLGWPLAGGTHPISSRSVQTRALGESGTRQICWPDWPTYWLL